jgi:hypothetical protein
MGVRVGWLGVWVVVVDVYSSQVSINDRDLCFPFFASFCAFALFALLLFSTLSSDYLTLHAPYMGDGHK